MRTRLRTLINVLLAALVVLDVGYAVVCFAAPELWFRTIHGAPYVDPAGLLRRTGGLWAAFALFQAIALFRWRERPHWLGVVAGVRLTELFADWTYLYFAETVTALGRLGLLLSTPVNFAIGLFFLGLFREPAPSVPPETAIPLSRDKPSVELTPQEQRLRVGLMALAVLFASVATAAVVLFFLRLPAERADSLPLAYGATALAIFALVAALGAADVRRHDLLIRVLIWGQALAVVVGGVASLSLAQGDRVVAEAAWLGRPIAARALVMGLLAADAVILVLLVWLHGTAVRARYRLRYLTPMTHRALCALADVLVSGEDEIVEPVTIASRVDRYLAAFRARRKWLTQAALIAVELYPLASLRAPFSLLDAASRRRFVQDRFYREITERLILGVPRRLLQAAIRLGQQLCYLGYYSDPRTFPAVGYVPFSARPRYATETANAPVAPSLDILTPARLREEEISADILIIGSGAAGAVLAHELVSRGRSVLILERGRHVAPTQFTEDEMQMLLELYDEGALQLAQDFRFQVLQGSCVGGTTVVNNAVSFDLPAPVLERWNDPRLHDAGLDPARLAAATGYIRDKLRIRPQDQTGSILNPADRYFAQGVERLGLDRAPNRYAAVEANIGRCLGCGYCNIGCKYGTKLSMLETFLPWAQSAGDCTILAECKVRRIRWAGGKRVTGVDCDLGEGRRIRVTAKTVIVSAGAISSSYLLLRSGIEPTRVGRAVAFNMGSPMTARLPDVVNAYDGLQISHYLELAPDPGFMIETWFNPPVAQAMAMPGWFEDHFRNMRDYAHMTAAAPLVGTAGTGRVGVSLWGDVEIHFKPAREDLARLLRGLKIIGEIFLAAGADRVMPSTFRYLEFKRKEDMDLLDEIVLDTSDIQLGTGHPQGGNAISKRRDRGVVDPEFRVRGFENLYCCDASVFPTSVGVNPQVTVMTLAKYAADAIR